MFPFDKNSGTIIQNEGFAKKIRYYYVGKLLVPAGICKKQTVENSFQRKERDYSIKNEFPLI